MVRKICQNAVDKGYSTTLLGRKRYYKVPQKGERDYFKLMSAIGRKGKNSPIQGSAADMIKLALIEIDERLKKSKLDAFLINTIHDEIVVEAAEKDAETTAQIVKECMESAGKKLAPNVPILAEGGVADFWTH